MRWIVLGLTFAGQDKVRTISVYAIILVVGLVGWHTVTNRQAPTTDTAESPRKVSLALVSALSSGDSSLTVVGQVNADAQATVHAGKGGQIINLYKHIGDSVSAGEVIAELEHGSESAAVAQARAGLAAAQANLSKVTGGARTEQKTILQSSSQNAADALASARTATVNTLLSTYQTILNSVTITADSMITNPTTQSPQFAVTTSDSRLTTTIQNSRTSIQSMLDRVSTQQSTLSSQSDLLTEITKTETDVRTTLGLLNNIADALYQAIPTNGTPANAIAGYTAAVAAARGQLTGTLAALSGARDNLNGKTTALTVAQQTLAQGVTGGQPEDVSATQAAVDQARAGVAAASAAYEHSIIRAPIGGSITMLNLKEGDFVGAFAPAVTIANNGELEVVAYVSDADLKTISVGMTVNLDSSASGVVTHLPDSVDPMSKKAEVHIGVTKRGGLTNGQSTTVSFVRSGKKTTSASSTQSIIIPITSLKMTPSGPQIFTLSTSSTLLAHPVSIGSIVGDRVVIVDGLTPQMVIITDARGLAVDEKVQIATQ
jgi:multidrug efflux pump subunit AcrA (membrane-fusion protein)